MARHSWDCRHVGGERLGVTQTDRCESKAWRGKWRGKAGVGNGIRRTLVWGRRAPRCISSVDHKGAVGSKQTGATPEYLTLS